MATTCTRCEGSGFLNIQQLPDEVDGFDWEAVEKWISENEYTDMTVCDCCGDGDGWYGIPGEHYNADDPPGNDGPYASNGGLCRCH